MLASARLLIEMGAFYLQFIPNSTRKCLAFDILSCIIIVKEVIGMNGKHTKRPNEGDKVIKAAYIAVIGQLLNTLLKHYLANH